MMQSLPTLQRYSSGWRADLLALFAGAAAPLSFAPLGWWPLAIFGTALLFVLWLFADVRGACRQGNGREHMRPSGFRQPPPPAVPSPARLVQRPARSA